MLICFYIICCWRFSCNSIFARTFSVTLLGRCDYDNCINSGLTAYESDRLVQRGSTQLFGRFRHDMNSVVYILFDVSASCSGISFEDAC